MFVIYTEGVAIKMDFRRDTSTKQDVLRYIMDHPSCTPADIYHALGLNIGTTRYHIRTLTKESKITAFRDGKYMRLYHVADNYRQVADVIGYYIKNKNIKRILGCIMKEPGITLLELSRTIEVGMNAVSRIAMRLHDMNLISIQRDGEQVKLFLTVDAERILRGADL